MWCSCVVLLCGAPVWCSRVVLLCGATVWCSCALPLCALVVCAHAGDVWGYTDVMCRLFRCCISASRIRTRSRVTTSTRAPRTASTRLCSVRSAHCMRAALACACSLLAASWAQRWRFEGQHDPKSHPKSLQHRSHQPMCSITPYLQYGMALTPPCTGFKILRKSVPIAT